MAPFNGAWERRFKDKEKIRGRIGRFAPSEGRLSRTNLVLWHIMLGGILWRLEFVVASQIFSPWLFHVVNGELAGLKNWKGGPGSRDTRKSGCKKAIRTGRHGGRIFIVS